MALDNEIELLTEYNEWKSTRKAVANDLSPEAFMVDRAKEQALTMLEDIQQEIDFLLSGEQNSVEATTHIQEILNR